MYLGIILYKYTKSKIYHFDHYINGMNRGTIILLYYTTYIKRQ